MGGYQSLHQLVHEGSLETLRAACAKTKNINVREDIENLQKWTPLQFAAWMGNAEAIEILVEYGAALHPADSNGSTALHLAATKGHAPAARALLDVGAQINAIDRNGMTSLHKASLEGHDEVVKLLCERYADVNSPDYQGATALHLASYEGHLLVVYILLENGASVMTVDHGGNTPLHDAASGGHQMIMQRLIRHGAHVGLRNQSNITAEEIFDARSDPVPMGIDVEDIRSTTNDSDTMPATPRKYTPSFAADSSSVDACSCSGSTDDDSIEDEVTSHWKGGPEVPTEVQVHNAETPPLLPTPNLDTMETDQEPPPPEGDATFSSPDEQVHM